MGFLKPRKTTKSHAAERATEGPEVEVQRAQSPSLTEEIDEALKAAAVAASRRAASASVGASEEELREKKADEAFQAFATEVRHVLQNRSVPPDELDDGQLGWTFTDVLEGEEATARVGRVPSAPQKIGGRRHAQEVRLESLGRPKYDLLVFDSGGAELVCGPYREGLTARGLLAEVVDMAVLRKNCKAQLLRVIQSTK
jgi:hypothetical protein